MQKAGQQGQGFPAFRASSNPVQGKALSLAGMDPIWRKEDAQKACGMLRKIKPGSDLVSRNEAKPDSGQHKAKTFCAHSTSQSQ
jgi:hypothetical protein